jgi:hypothetical protein
VDAEHHRLEGGRVTRLACGDEEGEGPCVAVCGQVDLGAQPGAGASERVIGGLAAVGRPTGDPPHLCDDCKQCAVTAERQAEHEHQAHGQAVPEQKVGDTWLSRFRSSRDDPSTG